MGWKFFGKDWVKIRPTTDEYLKYELSAWLCFNNKKLNNKIMHNLTPTLKQDIYKQIDKMRIIRISLFFWFCIISLLVFTIFTF